MQVTITKAAKMAKVSRNTIYNDIESGVLSYTANARNKKLINIAELARVYDGVELEDNPKEEVLPDVQKRPDVLKSQSKQDISLQVIQERLRAAEKALETQNEERQRERQNYESQIDSVQKTLDKLQQAHGQTVALLEHKTNNGGGAWEKSIKAMEQRLSNQEKAAKEKAEREEKILRQNKLLKRALASEKEKLEVEQNKTFFQKLFG